MVNANVNNSIPIVSTDEEEVSFICSKNLFDDILNLFKDASEKLAIDRVKKGKKPAAIEI